jgi:FtsP/CotA-like multicopper oxidase with cupredoxin domain
MQEAEPPKLSDLIENDAPVLGPSTRRKFLANASTLSLAIPGVGAALAACSPGDRSKPDTTVADGSNPQQSSDDGRHRNSDSKLDSSLLKRGRHGNTSVTRATPQNEIGFHTFDPALPALTEGGLKLHWHAKEARIRIDENTVVAAWTFEGNIPGPVVHCRVGDTIEFTLTNDVDVPHSMDFHAAQIDPKIAFRSVPKGQSVTYAFKPKWAGAFVYHCGTAPVLMHIGSGMYGAIIVSPREGLPPAKEFVIVQGEFYLAEPANGLRAFDYQKMLGTLPDFVAFNGRPNQGSDQGEGRGPRTLLGSERRSNASMQLSRSRRTVRYGLPGRSAGQSHTWRADMGCPAWWRDVLRAGVRCSRGVSLRQPWIRAWAEGVDRLPRRGVAPDIKNGLHRKPSEWRAVSCQNSVLRTEFELSSEL